MMEPIRYTPDSLAEMLEAFVKVRYGISTTFTVGYRWDKWSNQRIFAVYFTAKNSAMKIHSTIGLYAAKRVLDDKLFDALCDRFIEWKDHWLKMHKLYTNTQVLLMFGDAVCDPETFYQEVLLGR